MKQHITVAYWLDALCDTTNKLDVFVALQAFDFQKSGINKQQCIDANLLINCI